MSYHRPLAALALGGIISVAACASGDPGDLTPAPNPPPTSEEPPESALGTPIAVEPHELMDAESGAMCLYPANRYQSPWDLPEVVSLEPGRRLHARIPYQGCLSSSCDIHRVATCDFRWDGDRLLLTSRLAFDEIQGQPCTMDCQSLVAECESEPLPEGEIRLRFGDHERRLVVPSETQACEPITCDRDADCAEDCAYDSHGGRMCQPWALVGEACGGFMSAELVRSCAPGLTCVTTSKLVDLPGTCLAVCETDKDCDDGVCTYIGEDEKVCLSPY